ncbi:MAG: Holliday junction resolvase RuvX [Gammaproteobacteria bacterium]|jgi:putative Holliday junction resolvase|nr:MAG: Holliday junction resolvase RuvX [Gammaproteobacteria bacterium]
MPEAVAVPASRPDGTVLAFDFGAKRIGVAVGETALAQAHPLTVIHAQANTERFSAIGTLIDEWHPVLLVVGMPAHLGDIDTPHTMAARCRRFGNQLHGRFGLPVDYADERLTSLDAEARLRETGHDARSAKAHLDAVAAQLILQTYFESHASHAQSAQSAHS